MCQGGSVSCIFGSLNTVCSRENLTEFWLCFFIACLRVSCLWLSSVLRRGGARAFHLESNTEQTNRPSYCLESFLCWLWSSPEWLRGSATNTHLLSICLCGCDSWAPEGFIYWLWLKLILFTTKSVSYSHGELKIINSSHKMTKDIINGGEVQTKSSTRSRGKVCQ